MNKEELRKQLEQEIENSPAVKAVKRFTYGLMIGGGIWLLVLDNPLWINVFGLGMALVGAFKLLAMLDRERSNR